MTKFEYLNLYFTINIMLGFIQLGTQIQRKRSRAHMIVGFALNIFFAIPFNVITLLFFILGYIIGFFIGIGKGLAK